MHGIMRRRRVMDVPAVPGGRTVRGIHVVSGIGVVVVKSRAGSRSRAGSGNIAPAWTRIGTPAWMRMQVARAWSWSYARSSTRTRTGTVIPDPVEIVHADVGQPVGEGFAGSGHDSLYTY